MLSLSLSQSRASRCQVPFLDEPWHGILRNVGLADWGVLSLPLWIGYANSSICCGEEWHVRRSRRHVYDVQFLASARFTGWAKCLVSSIFCASGVFGHAHPCPLRMVMKEESVLVWVMSDSKRTLYYNLHMVAYRSVFNHVEDYMWALRVMLVWCLKYYICPFSVLTLITIHN